MSGNLFEWMTCVEWGAKPCQAVEEAILVRGNFNSKGLEREQDCRFMREQKDRWLEDSGQGRGEREEEGYIKWISLPRATGCPRSSCGREV